MDNGRENWLQVETEEDELKSRLFTLSNCMTLCDVKCDNYTRLLVADIDLDNENEMPTTQLKVFKGTNLTSGYNINGIPSAIESFYTDEQEPRTPIVAVAVSETILFFRNLKPYIKWTVPEIEADELEKDLWRKLPTVRVDQQEAVIAELRTINCARLTRKSQKLFQIPIEERDAFIRKHGESPMTRHSSIVAMRCIQRLSSNPSNPPSYLVIATDIGDILILEAHGFGLLYKAKSCSYEITPSQLAVHGTFETDFRIIIAARNGAVYLLRKSESEGQEIFKIAQPLTGVLLLPIDQTILISSMEKRLVCYSKKGKQLYSVKLQAMPICLLPITLTHLGLTLTCVALAGGLVQFYMQRFIVDQFQMSDTVSALVFGRMGLEEHVLAMVTVQGDLFIKILKRNAIFEPVTPTVIKSNITSNKSQISILDKPKKSSIFVEQAAREVQNAKGAYGGFQVELWRLRHAAAHATLNAINSSESTISGDITHAPVKLSAEVCGAGPNFRLYLIIQNLSTYKMASNLTVLLHADRRHYAITNSVAKLPSILPGMPLKIDFEIIAVLNDMDRLPPHTLTPDNAHVRVILVKAKQAKPLIAAIVAMPQSEANT